MFRMTKKQEEQFDISRVCANCEFAVTLSVGEDQMLCRKRGIVSGGFHCRRFRYDLLKRRPPKPVILEKQEMPSLDLDDGETD